MLFQLIYIIKWNVLLSFFVKFIRNTYTTSLYTFWKKLSCYSYSDSKTRIRKKDFFAKHLSKYPDSEEERKESSFVKRFPNTRVRYRFYELLNGAEPKDQLRMSYDPIPQWWFMVFVEARVRDTNYLLFENLTTTVVHVMYYETFYVLRKCRHHRGTTYLWIPTFPLQQKNTKDIRAKKTIQDEI